MWPKYLYDISVFIIEPFGYRLAEVFTLNLCPHVKYGKFALIKYHSV